MKFTFFVVNIFDFKLLYFELQTKMDLQQLLKVKVTFANAI